MLFPAGLADSADIWAIFFDRSDTEITLKTFDDSGSAWSESSAITTCANIANDTVGPQFCGAVRASDNHLIMLVANNSDNAGADLECWDITDGSTITQRTTLITNTDDFGGCALCIDVTGATTTYHAFHIGKSDGSETAYTAVRVYRKTSTDLTGAWTDAGTAAASAPARAILHVSAPLNVANDDWDVQYFGTEAALGNVRRLFGVAWA